MILLSAVRALILAMILASGHYAFEAGVPWIAVAVIGYFAFTVLTDLTDAALIKAFNNDRGRREDR